MTCIAAVTNSEQVWMGGDSAGVSGWDLSLRADPKVFTNGEFILGFTTSFRMGNLLRFAFTPPTPHEGQDLFAFMCVDFVNAVRDCLKAGGYASKSNETESGGTFLVGFRGRLFRVDSDYQVGESRGGYDAVGCGAPYALGALSLMRSDEHFDRFEEATQVRNALEAAESHSAGVRGPFTILSTGASDAV